MHLVHEDNCQTFFHHTEAPALNYYQAISLGSEHRLSYLPIIILAEEYLNHLISLLLLSLHYMLLHSVAPPPPDQGQGPVYGFLQESLMGCNFYGSIFRLLTNGQD